MRKNVPVADRLIPRLIPDGECLVWSGAKSSGGYGVIQVDGRAQYVHRVMYALVYGEVPEGLQLDHLCRNRACANVDHLEPVTGKENILRGECPSAVNARRTHCIHGHEFTEENTYRYGGSRKCRACQKRRGQAHELTRVRVR